MSTSVAPMACVIVTYNGAPWLHKCLSSIQAGTHQAKIIVVDNDSQDETVAIAQSFPGVEVILSGSNLGFGRANNIGIARALSLGCSHVFLLNQDAHLAADALAILHAISVENPKLGILCPLQLDEEGHDLDPTFLRYYVAPHAPSMLNDAMLGRPLQSHYPAAAAPAAAWLLTRRFLETAGGFDPLFFMYGEDDDLCSRAVHHGFQITIVPGAHFYHCRGFRAEVEREPSRMKLRRRGSRLRSSMVKDIKHPQGSTLKNAWQSLSRHWMLGLSALMANLDWIEAAAATAAALHVLTELPVIHRHREACLATGPHWLAQTADPPADKAPASQS